MFNGKISVSEANIYFFFEILYKNAKLYKIKSNPWKNVEIDPQILGNIIKEITYILDWHYNHRSYYHPHLIFLLFSQTSLPVFASLNIYYIDV